MEIVMSEQVKIPNSVIVSGLIGVEFDEEITEHLKTHGKINRILPIEDDESPFYGQLIYEFESGASMESLQSLLPLTYDSPSRADVTYKVKALASVYTPTASSSATCTYLEELQTIAKLSGKSFEELLRGELAKLTTSAASPLSNSEDGASEFPGPGPRQTPVDWTLAPPLAATFQPILESTSSVDLTSTLGASSQPRVTFDLTSVPPPTMNPQPPALPIQLQNLTNDNTSPVQAQVESKTYPHLSVTDVNPPDIQRVVIEHIVRSQEAASHHLAPSRLRAFSGRSPRPANEVDYDTWRTNVELMMNDPAISDLHRSRRILDSLLPPAIEVTKHLGPQASPAAYLELLDSAYGTVEDGDELFAKFLTTFQDPNEKPSSYLHRLQVVLGSAVRRGGVSASEVNRHLLNQFCRNCWDNALLTDLQLKHRKNNPPSFAELLLLLRTEEDKHAAKVTRMKQHLGASKQRVTSHLQSACAYTDSNETEQLQKQVAALQSQLTNLKKAKTEKDKSANPKVATDYKAKSQKHEKQLTSSRNSSKPRPWYCFRCGEDGHIKPSCENEPNPSLVAAKRKLLNDRQLQWEAQPASSDEDHLNN